MYFNHFEMWDMSKYPPQKKQEISMNPIVQFLHLNFFSLFHELKIM